LAAAGNTSEACSICAELKRIRPEMTIRSLDDLPFAKPGDREHFATSLKKAGLNK
jgi:hypothetical protein